MRACDNPYSVQRIHTLRYRLSAAEWGGLFDRWEAEDRRGALVGSHGHGKSTLLREFGERLATRGWQVRQATLRRGERRVPSALRRQLFEGLGPNDILLLDGVEQLSSLSWIDVRWATRRAAGILVTSHRSGRLPTIFECHTVPSLLADLMAELHPWTDCAQPSAAALFHRHDGNLRLALRELYDLHAGDNLCPGLPPDRESDRMTG